MTHFFGVCVTRRLCVVRSSPLRYDNHERVPRGGMDPNKWPDKAKEAYNYGVTGFGTGWQRQFLVRGLNPKP